MLTAIQLARLGETLQLLGKFLLVSLFWWDAVFQFIPNFDDVVGYIGQSILPYPTFVAICTIGFLISAPILLFIRSVEVVGFLVLAIFCLMTALIFHPYWNFIAEDRLNAQIHFMKDLALAGAMLALAGLKMRLSS